MGTADGKSVCLQSGRPGFNPWVGKIPWRRKWQPTLILLPGKFHGWRRLQSMGLQRVWHDWATSFSLSFTFTVNIPWGHVTPGQRGGRATPPKLQDFSHCFSIWMPCFLFLSTLWPSKLNSYSSFILSNDICKVRGLCVGYSFCYLHKNKYTSIKVRTSYIAHVTPKITFHNTSDCVSNSGEHWSKGNNQVPPLPQQEARPAKTSQSIRKQKAIL